MIVNKVLQVPYSSHVRLHCVGDAVVWKYSNKKLVKFRNIFETIVKKFDSSVIQKDISVVIIENFGKSNRGFYTCIDRAYSKEETILLTSGNAILVQ